MGKIQILDCTLRDGGYVNNWEFGKETIEKVIRILSAVGVDLVELGFFRDEAYGENRSIFNDISQVQKITKEYSDKTNFAGLIEMANPFPFEKLASCPGDAPKTIRYSFWKRLIDEGYENCRIIADKGYKLCCQPTRVEQYSDEDFKNLCLKFSELNPYALYIVDTFGLLEKKQLLNYAEIANKYLAKDVILGYHAHNNMNQAFSNACAFTDLDFGERTVQLDATIGGIGRGAGNLALENILLYLNHTKGTKYDLTLIYKALDECILPVKKNFPWGYSETFFITAAAHCNPNYANYFLDKGLSLSEVQNAISLIEGEDKYLYSKEKAERFVEKMLKG